MGELIELIIRAIEALSGKKRDSAPDPNWQAQQPAPQPMAPTARQASSRRNRPARVPPAVPQSAYALAEELVEVADLVEVHSAPVARPMQRPKVTAGSIAQWARPKTLKSQFVL